MANGPNLSCHILMKKRLILALLATGLATAASAAVTAGLEVGYLTDNKDALWSGRVGWEFNATGNLSHQVELELATTEHSETGTMPAPLVPAPVVTVKNKLMPIMINYRAETTTANKLGFYFGAGVGQTKSKVSFAGSGVPTVSDSDNAFTVQAFAGMRYQVTPAAALHVGVKYLKIGDISLFGSPDIEVGDDFALTGGVTIRF